MGLLTSDRHPHEYTVVTGSSMVFPHPPSDLAAAVPRGEDDPVGERKQVTILFADLVGSTALCEGLDPEAVHELINAWMQFVTAEVDHCGGVVNQFSGDGVLALFGAPLAYEDAPQRACRAALAMQHGLKAVNAQRGTQLVMRIGIDTGQVFVGTLGSDLRKEYAALGSRTNVAKRVQEAAEPGAIMVGAATYELARAYFQFIDAGEFVGKGLSEPFRAYRLVGQQPPRSRLDVTLPRSRPHLIGREKELAQVVRCLDELRAGKPQLLYIEGEPGVGKSRLALELKRLAGEAGFQLWEGRALPYGEQLAYALFADAFRRLCGVGDGDPVAAIQRALQRFGRDLVKEAPFVEALLSVDAHAAPLRHLDPEARKAGIFATVQRLLRRAASDGPLVVLLDDFHWADPLSRELTEFLVQGVGDRPVCLCVISRPPAPQLPSLPRFLHLPLSCLAPVGTGAMIQSELNLRADDGGAVLCDWVQRTSGGNPLFIEEVLQMLVCDGALTPTESGWRVVGDIDEIHIPGALQDLIASRIDRLPEPEKECLQHAAVIGDEFGVDLVRALTGQVDVESPLVRLAEREFIVDVGVSAARAYRFKHGLTWKVAYNTLALRRRRPLHERVAQILEQLHARNLEPHYYTLARHYSLSPHVSKAVCFLRHAGQKAQREYANANAVAYFTQALETGAQALASGERIELLLARGEITSRLLGDYAAGDVDFDAARELAEAADSPRAVARAWLGKGHAFSCQYRFQEALASFDQALVTARAADCRAELIETLLQKALALGEKEERDTDGAVRCLEEALRLTRELHDERLEAQVLIQLGTLHYHRWSSEAAVRTFKECIALCRKTGDKSALSLALQNMARTYVTLGAHERAIEATGDLQALLSELGDERRAANCDWIAGSAWHGKGDRSRAVVHYEAALRRYRELGIRQWSLMSLRMLRMLYSELGNVEKQIQCLQELIPLVQGEGRWEEAAELLMEMGAALARSRMIDRARGAYTEAAKSYLEVGNHQQVRVCLDWLERSGNTQ